MPAGNIFMIFLHWQYFMAQPYLQIQANMVRLCRKLFHLIQYDAISIARVSVIDMKMPGIGLWIKLVSSAIIVYTIGYFVFKRGTENVVAKL